MATRSRTLGGTRTQNPTRVQIQPGTPVDESGEVKCSGHQMVCPKLRAGPTTKNAGRAFYCCPLPREDPKRCKFFKWHDELFPLANTSNSTGAGPSTPSSSSHRASASTLVQRTNQTLGQSPSARYGKPLGSVAGVGAGSGPSTTNSTKTDQPTKHRELVVVDDEDDDNEDEMEEIDWNKVDTDEIEREAIASTPGSSQRTINPNPSQNQLTPGGTTSFTDRLRNAVVEDGSNNKRQRTEEDDLQSQERTPKKALNDTNPFMASPSNLNLHSPPPHAILSPTMSSLDQISDHLHRQDRLLRAADQMKKGMRITIKTLQDKNKELEDRVKELEKRLGE
ncbi:uncharacterized protein IL334_003494 [Kwoniella shivajii]|uniref:GRF-type domain-containing protein n=1 Tax=Kwoniella shivajii TaxID=564305 RepID=A0ABZ1CXQ8_9TREE|nr:hypothetical protein IL334_003494 [Kwoniella shivajii]